MVDTALVLPPQPAAMLRHEFDVGDIIAQVRKIQAVMEKVMRPNEHYGIIPGTDKPTLLKPGAEKLCLTFRLGPEYTSTEHYDGAHLTIKSICTLYHIPTGQKMGAGQGSCSTKESKYAYRQATRQCPKCGKESIIKGKEEYGGGWLCFKKKGGCGAKFPDGAASIEAQESGRVPNEELADCYNTVLKMANKRSLVAAVLNVTAASDIFTQDLEELVGSAPTLDTPSVTPLVKPTPPAEPEGATPSREAVAGEHIAVLMGRITGLGDKLGLKAAQRAALWTEFCGEGATPKNVDIAALQDLYKELAKRWAANQAPAKASPAPAA